MIIQSLTSNGTAALCYWSKFSARLMPIPVLAPLALALDSLAAYPEGEAHLLRSAILHQCGGPAQLKLYICTGRNIN